MRVIPKIILLIAAAVFLLAAQSYGQDSESPSLGDVARQARLQKQKDAQAKQAAPANPSTANASAEDGQGKDAQSNDASVNDASTMQGKDTAANPRPAKTPHVITNDEIPEHAGPTHASATGPHPSNAGYPEPAGANNDAQAEAWKAQIQQMKNSIASLQSEIEKVNDSIRYAGANCVSGCAQWNERQKQKQDEVEAMKSQLEQMQQSLEEMQEKARKQGYGSSVYDP